VIAGARGRRKVAACPIEVDDCAGMVYPSRQFYQEEQKAMMWRSQENLKRPESSMARALWKSMGYSDFDLSRPLIGVANSWNRVVRDTIT